MKEIISTVERKALLLGIAANLIMAFSGWAVYYLSGSEALLLDGNMSFILFISSLVALKIAKIKSTRSDDFPFGLYVTEALYSFMKGLLLLGVVISAIVSNSSKILSYLSGDTIEAIKTGTIIYYAVAMVSICWGLSLYYYLSNKKINHASSMLSVDQKSSFIDGILSASTGAALVLIGYVDPNSSWKFLLYIGDAILVFVLALCMISQPISIIKNAFIELAGGKLQDKERYAEIKKLVYQHLDSSLAPVSSLNISKTGSSYLVVVGVELKTLTTVNADSWNQSKARLKEQLKSQFTFVDLEVIVQ